MEETDTIAGGVLPVVVSCSLTQVASLLNVLHVSIANEIYLYVIKETDFLRLIGSRKGCFVWITSSSGMCSQLLLKNFVLNQRYLAWRRGKGIWPI